MDHGGSLLLKNHPKRQQVLLKRRIIPIEEWLRDPYYIGSNAADLPNGSGMWQFWVDQFEAFFNLTPPKSTVIVTGSNRGGKSFNIDHFLVRYLYEISCFWCFPELFGLSAASNILFVKLSLSKAKAKDAGIQKLLRILDGIPYFQNEFPYRKDIRSKIVFPGVEIRPGSTSDDLLSEDLFGVIFDEANFVKAKAGGEFEKAKKIFIEARSRGQMTFSKRGVSRGFYALISSADSMSSFVESMIHQSRADGTGFVIVAAVYKVKPQAFSDKKFKVFAGVDDVPPHIIDEVESDVKAFIAKTYGKLYEDFLVEHSDQIEDVPVDFLDRFREDIVFSLRFISGRSMNTQAAFLKQRKMFDAIFKEELKSPLMIQVPTLSLLSDDVIQDFVDEEALLALYDTGSPVYIHFDLGLRGDVEGKQGDFAAVGASYKTEKNKIRILFYCRIARVSSSDEIDVSKIEDIVYWFMELGISVKLVTKDLLARGYFSQNLVKRLGKERVGDLSLDRSDVPFLIFSHLMKKGLLESYFYGPFVDEFPTLIHDRASQKVLKATGGHDDVSQAVIGSVYDCFQGEGMSFETMAAEDEAARSKSSDPDDFYNGALGEGLTDDFYSALLSQVDDAEKELPEEHFTEEAELRRKMLEKESPEFSYGRNRDSRPRIPKQH